MPSIPFSRISTRSLVQREKYFFSLYRTLQATLFVGLLFTPYGPELIVVSHAGLARATALAYLIAAIALLFAGSLTDHRRRAPVFLGIAIDITAAYLLMFATDRLDAGIATLVLINLASAATLVPLRSALLIAVAAGAGGFIEAALQTATRERSLAEIVLFAVAYIAAVLLSQLLRNEVASRQQLVERQESDLESLSQLNELIIRRMRSGVLVIDTHNKIQRINESAWHQLGQPSPTQKDLRPISLNLLMRLNEWRSTGLDNLEPVSLSEGQPDVIPRFVAVPHSESELTIGFLEDTTLATRHAEQLTLSSLGRLSASIAHEVRNPLAAISHAAQLLAESEELPPADRRLLDIIRGQCLRMNAIIENILQLSRRQRSRPEVLDLGTWANQFVEEFRTVQPMGRDRLELVVDDGTARVLFDPDQLQQVAWNLVKNALRYGRAEDGTASVTVMVRRLEDSATAVLEVRDQGPGIPLKIVQQIFEPFYTTGELGTGLGLYIARQLCETNQATLDYHSLPSGGACFRVAFLGAGSAVRQPTTNP